MFPLEIKLFLYFKTVRTKIKPIQGTREYEFNIVDYSFILA